MSKESALTRLYEALEMIGSFSARTEKEAVMKRTLDEPMKTFWRYALDPFKTYGITEMPNLEEAPLVNQVSDEEVIQLLDDLAERKLTGHAARDAVHELFSKLTDTSRIALSRILLKDLRVGVGISSTNKVFKGLVPDFKIMLADKMNKKKLKYPAICQPKLDGVRVLIVVDTVTHQVQFLSRSGKPLPALEHLSEQALSLAHAFARHKDWKVVVMDGEAITGDFAKTVSEARRKDSAAKDAKIYLFDAISGTDLSRRSNDTPCRHRIDTVQTVVNGYRQQHEDFAFYALGHIVANSEQEVFHYYSNCRLRGLEGVIVKDPSARYHFRRNAAWMKIKNEESADLIIIGAEEGEGKYECMLGALVVDYNGVAVRVGTGLTDEDRDVLWQMFLTGKLVGRLVEVEYMEVTPDGSLRHPRFKGFRDTADRPGDKL